MKITAKKSLGQNFLVNPHILDKIVLAAEISKEDTILEIGPGTGLLTRKLAEKAGRVIAIEKDYRLIEPLREIFKDSNVEIIEADILKFYPSAHNLAPNTYKVVANIPYYITSNLLRTIFESASWRMAPPKLIVLTIQKEVAQRIIAKSPHMNLLALSIQYYAEPKIIGFISKNNFRPVPKVDSAIIRLRPKALSVKPEEGENLFNLMRAGFSEKRKQLAGNLLKHLKIPKEKTVEALTSLKLSPTARAEELSLEQWQILAKIL